MQNGGLLWQLQVQQPQRQPLPSPQQVGQLWVHSCHYLHRLLYLAPVLAGAGAAIVVSRRYFASSDMSFVLSLVGQLLLTVFTHVQILLAMGLQG